MVSNVVVTLKGERSEQLMLVSYLYITYLKIYTFSFSKQPTNQEPTNQPSKAKKEEGTRQNERNHISHFVLLLLPVNKLVYFSF